MSDKATLGKPHTIRAGHWLAMAAALLGWMFDGFEMGLHPLVAKPAYGELVRPEVETRLKNGGIDLDSVEGLQAIASALKERVQFWNSLGTALFLFGAAAGGLVFGWLGDRIGRKQAMVYSVLFYTVFTGLGGFATAAWQLPVLRFVAALGMGGEWSLGVALVMEIWPAWARPYLAGVIGAAANLGFLIIAVVSLVLGDLLLGPDQWRPLMFIGVSPALLTFLILRFVPESERWQASQTESAGAETSSILQELFGPALIRRTLVAIGLASVALLGTWGAVQWMPLWVPSLAGASQGAKEATQIFSALGAIVGTFIAAVIAGKFGRRGTYFLLCVACLIVATILFRPEKLGLPEHVYGSFFLVLTFLLGLTTASFYGWFPLYFPELFPTRVRATGQGLAYNFGRIFAGVGNIAFTAPLLAYYDHHYPPAMAVVTLIYVAGMVLIWFAPETHGKPLPD